MGEFYNQRYYFRTSSTDDLGLMSDTNEDLSKINVTTSIIQNTPSNSSTKSKIKHFPRSTSKSVCNSTYNFAIQLMALGDNIPELFTYRLSESLIE